MKKILCILLSVCLIGGCIALTTACTPRSEKLLIANWGDYMPEEVYKGFEAWYKGQTGKTVKVVYSEYESNESMLAQVEGGRRDYDLVCPSDYMVERMKNKGLLLELREDTIDLIKEELEPRVVDFAKAFDTEFKYTMPYIWGTMGIMYNVKSSYNHTEMNSWSVLFENTKEETVFMKDSPRDSYTIAMLYANKRNLLDAIVNGADSQAYKNVLNPIFQSPSTATINEAKTILVNQKKSFAINAYDRDEAKDTMKMDRNGSKNYVGMFWSCDAGYVMNNDPNKDLRYVVPEEGSNVWMDAFVIPKYAKNLDAANYFIQYLLQEDIAYACMEEAGAASGVESAVEAYKADMDSSDFFTEEDEASGFKKMYMDMMFPSEDILNRCGMMKEFPEYYDALKDMWEVVKNS